MVLKRETWRRTIVVIAAYLLCVTLESAQSASPGQTKGGQLQQQKQQTKSAPAAPQLSPATQIKRLPTKDDSTKTPKAAIGNGGGVKRATPAIKDATSSKFQARMMHSDLSSAQTQDSAYSSLDGSQNSDMWPQNGPLTPTFTDQEQGDELVALASDSVESEQVVPSPSNAANRLPGQQHYPGGDSERTSPIEKTTGREQALNDNRQAEPLSAGGRQAHNIDEYYNDDEDEEEEPPSKAADFEPVEAAKEPVRATSSRYRSSHHADHFGEYQPPATAPLDDGSYRAPISDQLTPAGNKTSPIKLLPAPVNQADSAWQPKSSFKFSYEPQKLDSLSSGQQPGSGDNRHSNTAKRLATLLGGGRDSLGAFSRTDVAIEYLRNMLKSKQQSGSSNGNSNSTDYPNPKQQFDSSITDKNISLQRLSSFASKLNQIFNTTSPTKALISNETSAKVEQLSPIQSDLKKTATFASDINPPFDLNEPKTFLSQQADTKFSIVDAKPIPSFRSQLDNLSPPTTKTPSPVDRFYLNQLPQYPQDSLLASSSPNGTPLGGDYIESQDEFPRAVASRLRQPDRLVPSESRQIKSNQESGILGPVASNQARVTNLREIHHQEPAVSSTYFQMHQLPPVEYSIPPVAPVDPNTGADRQRSSTKLAQNLSSPDEAQKILAQDVLASARYHQFKSAASFDYEPVGNRTARKESKQDDQRRQLAPVQTAERQPQRHSVQQVAKAEQQTSQQVPLLSSKIYKNNANEQTSNPPTQQQQQQVYLAQDIKQPANVAPLPYGQNQKQQVKPPKIVSYNYFESPNEPGQSEYTETNYQLGDALYSSNGGMEHLLSNAELEAIQSQFMTAEHPVVPIGSAEQQISSQIQAQQQQQQQQQQQNYQAPDSSLAGLLAGLKPSFITPEALQKLTSPEKQAEEVLKELASQEQPASVMAPPPFDQSNLERNRANSAQLEESANRGQEVPPGKIYTGEAADKGKKKSLIVYLNHPRPVDMSPQANSNDGYNFAHSIRDQSRESSFISAKEFDSHGLSKDTKHLDVSNLHNLGEIKDGQDKDGLSVVVIGDAYKYKKIVLLISSKSGGLKFIPMVKDMKK